MKDSDKTKAEEWLKMKKVTESDFQDSGIPDFIAELLEEYHLYRMKGKGEQNTSVNTSRNMD